MDLGIRDKLALVTGASQGIGRAVALTLALEGAKVLAVARSREKLDSLADEARKSGREIHPLSADLSTPAGLENVIQAANELGTVELLLANTGGPKPGQAQALSLDEFRQAAEDLLYPMVQLSQWALGGMKGAGFGRILFITSLAVKEPIENLALSNTLRAAVTGYAKTLSREVAAQGITVNTLGPGYTKTGRVEELFSFRAKQKGIGLEAAYAEQASQIPAARLGKPQEIADVAAFLLSARASYLTGQSIVVDGGYLHGLL